MRTLQRVTGFMLGLAMVTAGVTPAAMADEELPQFSLSSSSGLPGSSIEVGQIDPCPTPHINQMVEVAFTDAAGVITPADNVIYVDADGDWNFPVVIRLPRRAVSNFDPLTFTVDAAEGVGTFRVRCVAAGETSAIVTREYEPRPFTITRSSLRLGLSAGTVYPGGVIRVSSVDPCPNPAASVTGAVGNSEASMSFNPTIDRNTGAWNVNVSMPEIITDPASGSKELPLGIYRVEVWCFEPERPLSMIQYANEILEVVAPTVRYVALGDSISSGVGTFDYFDTQNACQRSNQGYPMFVASQLNLGDPLFAACSGAVTDDFYVTNPNNLNEPPQLSHLTSQTEVVTLTVGGNDAGFGDVLRRCVEYQDNRGWGCSKDKALQRKVKQQFAALAGKATGTIGGRPIHSLLDVYRDIHHRAPGAKIYVGGYPNLFGEEKSSYQKVKSAPGGAACFMPILASVSYNDAKWLNRQTEKLNEVISDQVKKAQREGIQITYVPPDLFKGHGQCDSSHPWINEIVIDHNKDPQPESFHPNSEGYWLGYGLIFETMIRRGL